MAEVNPGGVPADPQPGTPGTWYIDTCNLSGTGGPGGSSATWQGLKWIAQGQPAGTGQAAVQQAVANAQSQLSLMASGVRMAPGSNGWVNFPEWLWIDPASVPTLTTQAKACAGNACAQVAARATATSVTWSTGDGTPATVCAGLGTPFDPTLPYSGQATACSHTFRRPGTFEVTATISWQVSWNELDPGATAAGSFADTATTAPVQLTVKDIESVNLS